jgi:hypothetical protein
MRSSSNRSDARLIHALDTKLDTLATEKSRAFWERYVKSVVPFRGFPMASIRKAVHAWWHADGPSTLRLPAQKALGLFKGTFCEDKLAVTLVLKERLRRRQAAMWAQRYKVQRRATDRDRWVTEPVGVRTSFMSRPLMMSLLLVIACGPENQGGGRGTEAELGWTPGQYEPSLIQASRSWRSVLPSSYPSTGGHSGQRVRTLFNPVAEPTYAGTADPVTFAVGSIITKHVVASDSTPLVDATRVYFMRKEPAGYDPAGNDWSWAVANRAGATFTFSQQGKSSLCTGCHSADARWDFARTVQVFRTQTPP